MFCLLFLSDYNKSDIGDAQESDGRTHQRTNALRQMSSKKQRVGSRLSLPKSLSDDGSAFAAVEMWIDQMNANNEQMSELRSQLQKTVNPQKEK